MMKPDLVKKLREETGYTNTEVGNTLDTLVRVITEAVTAGDVVKIPGLGVFKSRQMKARMGRNPQTGAVVKIPARKRVGFTVAKAFKDAVA